LHDAEKFVVIYTDNSVTVSNFELVETFEGAPEERFKLDVK
jgi:hypothetical protein